MPPAEVAVACLSRATPAQPRDGSRPGEPCPSTWRQRPVRGGTNDAGGPVRAGWRATVRASQTAGRDRAYEARSDAPTPPRKRAPGEGRDDAPGHDSRAGRTVPPAVPRTSRRCCAASGNP